MNFLCNLKLGIYIGKSLYFDLFVPENIVWSGCHSELRVYAQSQGLGRGKSDSRKDASKK